MRKMKPSAAAVLLCATPDGAREKAADSFQPWHRSLLPRSKLTTKVPLNWGWQDGESAPPHGAETSVSTGHKLLSPVSFEPSFILDSSKPEESRAPTAVFGIGEGGMKEGRL